LTGKRGHGRGTAYIIPARGGSAEYGYLSKVANDPTSAELLVVTQLLETAMKRVAALPKEEQDEFASFILAELDSERRWDELFAKSQDALSDMANLAVAEDKAGKTAELDLDRDFPKN
jgi:hypothetical protein